MSLLDDTVIPHNRLSVRLAWATLVTCEVGHTLRAGSLIDSSSNGVGGLALQRGGQGQQLPGVHAGCRRGVDKRDGRPPCCEGACLVKHHAVHLGGCFQDVTSSDQQPPAADRIE